MLQAYFYNILLDYFPFDPTLDQLRMFEHLAALACAPEGQLLVINGYAGTGKTSAMGTFVKVAKKQGCTCVLLAPTGRAAKVLALSAQEPVRTIHRAIFRQKTAGALGSEFSLDRNRYEDVIFIVDEASLISNQGGSRGFGSGRLLDDLIQYVCSGRRCGLVLMGDSAQLPPIFEQESYALSRTYLSAYDMHVEAISLKDVVRHQEASEIIQCATQLRLLQEKQVFQYPKFKVGADVRRIGGGELLESLDEAYGTYGEEEVMIITSSNKRAMQYNIGVRNTILYRESELERGDRLMIVKNNYFWTEGVEELSFLANGEVAQVQRVGRSVSLYGFRFVELNLLFESLNNLELDVLLNMDSLSSPGAALTREQEEGLYEAVRSDYDGFRGRDLMKELRKNKYYNALQAKYAYAITCHKAQGGQWAAVFIDYAVFDNDQLNMDYLKWLYTALTRAQKEVYLVNFPEAFFG